MNTNMQAETPTIQWLYEHGYTICAAARKIRRSHGHVSLVLRGKRESPNVMAALLRLPKRALVLRERHREPNLTK